ncbi:MAG: hypothetical protein UX47_C0007G0096 [Candidatus Collierbacteria bacterium GW2011_GWA2_46_26]|uniref:Uncharacterized protein n=1 Tax=Candidatus Collierbacteria bacterium GW2011_GWA2_46_26 TaxID=1618381 RepID=A0A0G1PJI4_9BACT|nr:MAG: hypothetical protein UW29_C0006G0066 [Candidatus Collierbacteria bacterium GW2011_GWC2_44_13]KKU32852.1 MAG: hypothetical protein UX47_C0007G0096 [Candidatus Collierbacteria bacterium GW2011_GWA2_46_26]OGD80500.1 MAG: hypothetical protein A2320_02125 [Pseudomonadales bacterium GWC2_63_15]
MGVFQGHQVASLLGTLIMAVWFILPLIFKKLEIMPKIGRGMKFWDYFLVYAYALLIPNSTYAMFEIRHLLYLDGVADLLSISSFVVFGSLSLIGLLTTIWGIRLVVDHYAKSKKERAIYTIALSTICSFGAVVGIMQFASFPAILFPPVLILCGIELLARPHLILVALATTLFLFILNLLLDYFHQPT